MKTDNSFKSDLFVSVVVPVHNAETYIDPFLHEVSVVLSRHFKDHEIIIVDNCSRDGTVGLVEKLQREIHNIQLYCLARRIGIDGAFVVGLEHSIGDVIVTMDPAWDPPERILDLIECYYKGNEIVYGLRRDRARRGEGRGIYECFARGFYKLYRLLAREDIPAELSTFRLLSRRVVNTFMENRDRYSLFAVIAAFTGIPYAILEYDRIQRSGAQAEVDYIDAFSRAIDLLLLSSKRPLRIMTLGSLIGAMISFLYGIYVFVLHLLKGDEIAQGWASMSLQVSGLFFLQFVVLALISEYLIRVFVHTQNRPPYLVVKESSSLVLSRKQELNLATVLENQKQV